jgi:hypothetical protein
MFGKGNKMEADKLPGFISVPLNFNVRDLSEFVKKTENLHKAQKLAKAYLADKEQMDLAIS